MQHPPHEVLTVIKALIEARLRNWPVDKGLARQANFEGTALTAKVEYLQFSDTLLIWCASPDERAPQEAAELIDSVCLGSV